MNCFFKQVTAIFMAGFPFLAEFQVAAQNVFINEVFAKNSTYAIEDRIADWIELYNPTDFRIDLEGMSLSDSPSAPRRWIFRTGTVIEAKRFLVIHFDNQQSDSTLNTGFGLSANGGAVYLYGPQSNLLDSVIYGIQAADYSIGRLQQKDSNWALTIPSFQSANALAELGDMKLLRINEWMADPISGDDWFELYNPQSKPVSLSNLFLSDDVTLPRKSTIPALSFMGTKEYGFQQFIASGSTNSGANHVNFKLSASGEGIGLYSSSAGFLDTVTFSAQSLGVSQGRLPDGAARIVSFVNSSTPELSNYLPLTNVVVNEVLTHTDPPQMDAIELFNLSSGPVDVGGWYLSDSDDNFMKYRLPQGTILDGNGFKVFTENQFADASLANGFMLNSSEGDSVILSQTDSAGNLTGYRSIAKFGPAANGVTFGRFQSTVAVEYIAQRLATLGGTNSDPLVGPLVISEVMYHPPDVNAVDNTQHEFVELQNISARPLPLYDLSYPSNIWRLRGGIEFEFPQNVIVPAGGVIVLVSFHPIQDTALLNGFLAKYPSASGAQILGPYRGKLSNASDRITLQKPDVPQGAGHANEGTVPFLRVDQIEYTDSSPWPVAADGTGSSLQRKNPYSISLNPSDWEAKAPSPGQGQGRTPTDQDGDGMLDTWEVAHRLNSSDANDAGLDPDLDGMINFEEFICGTDPNDPNSKLQLQWVRSNGSGIIRFSAMPNISYVLQYRNTMEGSWITLSNVTASTTSRSVDIPNVTVSSELTRMYRLLAPGL